MTKIMTVYVAFDESKILIFNINNKHNFTKTYKTGGSDFLEIDDQVTIDDLLKGIIIQSDNDASITLSECLAGTEQDFAKLMNVYAKKLAMENTNFTNSSEFKPEDNHYSSVYGTAILSNALIRDFPNLYTYFPWMNFPIDISQPIEINCYNKLMGLMALRQVLQKIWLGNYTQQKEIVEELHK